MVKFNSENMTEALDRFGKQYKYPIYASIRNMTGFFSRPSDVISGYAAVTDDNFLILVQIPVFGTINDAEYFQLPVLGIKKLKLKKTAILNVYTVDIRGIADGKKYRFKIVTVSKVAGKGFPEQTANHAGFIDKLKRWSDEI